MSKIKLFVRTEVEGEITRQWLENEKGEEVDLAPKECTKCTDGIWSGHVKLPSGNVYCGPCFAERYNEKMRERMYEHDEQYYTEWTEDDFDSDIYEVIHVNK